MTDENKSIFEQEMDEIKDLVEGIERIKTIPFDGPRPSGYVLDEAQNMAPKPYVPNRAERRAEAKRQKRVKQRFVNHPKVNRG